MNDLSGVWSGSFTYRMIYQETPFTARIDVREGVIGGTVSEVLQTEYGFTPDGVVASIAGTVEGDRVRFTKSYPPGIQLYDMVDYEGVLSADGQSISGIWRTKLWSGAFTMRRSEG